MQDLTKLEKILHRVKSQFLFGFEYSNEYLNYTETDKSKNWKAYENFTIAFTSLEIQWNSQEGFEKKDVTLESVELFKKLLNWLHVNSINLRFFPPKVFRSSEIVHGLVSLLAEKFKINNLLYFGYQKLVDLKTFEPLFQLRNEAYFLDDKNLNQSPDRLLYLLIQEAYSEKSIINLLKQNILNHDHPFHDYFEKLMTHYDAQLEFLSHSFFKLQELKPELKDLFSVEGLPLLHYREKYPEFLGICTLAETMSPDFVSETYTNWLEFAAESNLPINSRATIRFPDDFTLEKSDQVSLVQVMHNHQKNYVAELQKKVDELGIQNDLVIRNAYAALSKKRKMHHEYDTSVYQYYLAEAGKIKWDIQDIYKVLEPLGPLTLSDNDLELCDIVKEIAYCEGFAYTIGHQNLYHAGHMHPFTMWITQQCHEEMKHFHAVRVLLQQAGVCTQNLDEDFMAQVFEEPNPDAYHDQYNVFNLNFLGEVHNIRAYLLLADAFENKDIQKVMRWVTDDEVVHKKVFHFHFKYLSQKHKDWEKNAYECMLDTGFGTHQASHCSRYKVMMEKIGKYYDRSGKYSALEFLNMSMRAQYLELKSLYSPEIFKISEFDFRRKHLKAFVH